MPPVSRKDDAGEIVRVLRGLAQQEWIKDNREWWPKFVFHYTDVQNAVEILKFGKLLCRSELEKRHGMIVDNASRNVISNTDPYVQDFVRLYFRPQTPTQFRNEGIRPKTQRAIESHCPVPIFFLFDSEDVLTRRDSQFSEGNLAVASTILCNTAKALEKFDFKQIYHVGRFQPHFRDSIIYRRNAEVVIPTEMDLSSLKFIFCRSPTEKETLLHLLPSEIYFKWSRKIVVASKSQIYNCKWTFVETAELTANLTAFRFSPDTETPGPFKLALTLTDVDSNRVHSYQKYNFIANSDFRISVPKGVERYEIKMTLDDDLAFHGAFYGEDIPF